MFSAGLTVDANARRIRSQQWDTAFEILREELRSSSTEDDTAPNRKRGSRAELREQIMATAPLLPDDVDWDTVHKVAGMDLIEDPVFDKRQSEVEFEQIESNLWDLLSFDTNLPGTSVLSWPANSGRKLVKKNLPPQSLWSPENLRLKALRNRQTWKKLALQERSVGILIGNLLIHADAHLLPRESLTSLSPRIWDLAQLESKEWRKIQSRLLQEISTIQQLPVETDAEKIEEARSRPKFGTIPQYFQDHDGDFHRIAQQMNSAIKNLFIQKSDKRPAQSTEEITLAVAKICHNLLVSSAAPTVQTFNILLSGFSKWKMPQLVDDVLAALETCMIRPNEITCAAVLNHYTQTQRPDVFSRYVAKMRGVGDALMLAKPNITINEKSEGRLIRISESKVFQKVYPTPLVFRALMQGVLEFAGFERALDIYYEMKDDGWGLDVLGLIHFLDNCIQRSDLEGGLLIWKEITGIQQRMNPQHIARAYAHLLSLCSVTRQTAAFNSVLNEVVRHGFNRKTILKSAMARTAAVLKKNAEFTPAWTADNVLIAMSEYMKDDVGAEDKAMPLEEENNTELTAEPEPEPEPEPQPQPPPMSPDEAWKLWLEHELRPPSERGIPRENLPKNSSYGKR